MLYLIELPAGYKNAHVGADPHHPPESVLYLHFTGANLMASNNAAEAARQSLRPADQAEPAKPFEKVSNLAGTVEAYRAVEAAGKVPPPPTEAWMHAACLSIAEGAPGWADCPAWSPAIQAVQKLRAAYENLRAQTRETIDPTFAENLRSQADLAATRRPDVALPSAAEVTSLLRGSPARPIVADLPTVEVGATDPAVAGPGETIQTTTTLTVTDDGALAPADAALLKFLNDPPADPPVG